MTEPNDPYAPKPTLGLVPRLNAARQVTQLRQLEQEATNAQPNENIRGGILDRIADDIDWLPLKEAVQMGDEIVSLPDYKPPSTKIEFAMLLNLWAQSRIKPS